MNTSFQSFEFPTQRRPTSEKNEAWVAASVDWIIAQGQSIKDEAAIEEQYQILQGNIPDDYYKKTINPYNSKEERYTRFPATMRNYDMIKGIIRRYIGEYLKNNHDFIVGANNPEVVLARNAKLRQELAAIVEQQIAAKIQQAYQQFVNESNPSEEFNPQQAIDIEAFISKFNEDYIDDVSAQGQEVLNVIKDITEDSLFYAIAYFDFVTFGECYTYSEIKGNTLVKKNIYVRDAFPINNDNYFREDDDMFACRRKLSYQQIVDEFDEHLTENQLNYLRDYYGFANNATSADLAFSTYESYFPEVCGKYNNVDRAFFKKSPTMKRDNNSGLYDVWHVVWRGEQRKAIVTFVNEAGLMDSREEEDNYILNPELGDISIDYIYIPQVHESVRIGGRNDAIYPYGARAVAFERNGKLPYNGLNELLPGFGKFSIVENVIPYQVFYNIVAYSREMAVAKNRLSLLMIGKSLLGKVPEDTIYKMLADGVLYYDDTTDQNTLRAQQIRMLSANNGEYITQLTTMLQDIEKAANNQVDMTPQRYGEIANSAGKGVTDEAITRGSMGSVIIEFAMDSLRERDYARDMDFTKFAWIDGLDTSYRDTQDDLKYISLNVDKHNYADYIIKAKKSVKEREKLEQLKQFAFSAAQNGDSNMAIAAITGDNVAAIVKLIKKYDEQKTAHEENIKQLEQQTQQMIQEFELKKIAAKGEEDRKTKELEGIIEAEIQLIKADANMISFDNGVDEADKQAGMMRLEGARAGVQREKMQIDRERNVLDAYSKSEDRKVKQKDIDAKIQIAKTNKNRYDFKKKAKSK